MAKESVAYKWYADIKEQALRLPILDVVQRYASIPLTGLRSHHKGTNSNCPWHGGDSLNFYTDSSYNNCSCFKCGEKGVTTIGFVMRTYGLDFKSALIRLAEDYMLESEFPKPTYEYKAARPKKVAPVAEMLVDENKKEAPLRKPQELDFVYRLVLEVCGLTREHQKKLMLERYLTKQQIKERLYSSLPSKDIISELAEKLKERNIPIEILIGVPGFYVETKDNSVHFRMPTKLDYKTPLSGIMIPIPDKNGFIRGVQYRRDELEQKKDGSFTPRYSFITSNYDVYIDKGRILGCSAGSPIGVIYPSVLKTKMVFITEGMFKAEILSKTFGAVVIVVQGVTSVKNIDLVVSSIKETLEEQQITPERIIMAFDADSFKHEVYMALKRVSFLLQSKFEGIEMYYLVWNPKYGKGIDDLINGNPDDYLSLIKNVLKDKWDSHYIKAYEKALNSYFSLNPGVAESFGLTDQELIHCYVMHRIDIGTEDAPWKDAKFHDFFQWLKQQEGMKETKEVINELIAKELFKRFK